jgi:hypothetical protein
MSEEHNNTLSHFCIRRRILKSICICPSCNVTLASDIKAPVNLFVADDETRMGQLRALCLGEK